MSLRWNESKDCALGQAAVLSIYFYSVRCFLNQSMRWSSAVLASSPLNPCPAPGMVMKSEVTFAFLRAAIMVSLWAMGTRVSLSPWMRSVGGSSEDTWRRGDT